MEKIEKILTDCIRDIKSGKISLAECLDRYNSKRDELAPLLKIALNIHESPAFNLDNSYKQAAKAQLLRRIQDTRQKKSKSLTDILSLGIPPRLTWARAAMSVLVVIILMAMLAGGTAYASQSSLPGDFLYPVKEKTEDARLFIAGDESAKARLNLKFAQTRLDEMNELTSISPERAGLAIDGYKDDLDAAFQHIRQITDTLVQTNLLIQATENMQNQLAFCDSIIDNEPSSSEQVNLACNLSVNRQMQLLELLSQRNTLRATQLNLIAMTNRIQRAQEKVDSNQYYVMQEVLRQYQQFTRLGEQILHDAQASNSNIAEIETLSIQALSSHLDILNSISQNAPLEYQESIENCRQMTQQYQTLAQYTYQEKNSPNSETGGDYGNSGAGHDEPGSGTSDPGTGIGEPGGGAGEPGSSFGEPGSGAGKPGSGSGEPGNGTNKSGNGNGEPGNGADEPGDDIDEHGNGQ